MTAPLATSGQHRPWRGRSFLAFAQRVLGSTRLPWYLGGVSLLLGLSSLGAGWTADDYFQGMRLVGKSRYTDLFGGGTDIFAFFDGDPHRTRRLMDAGAVPWWTNPSILGAFWRPLATLTHQADYLLWPRVPALMHLQSVLWYCVLTGVVWVAYRRLMGGNWISGLAALMYTVDDAHGMPIGFLANRNAILSTLLGLIALTAHVRWRRRRQGSDCLIACTSFTAGLLSGESCIAATAYLFAYAWVFERGSRWRRLMTLAPYAVITIVWRIAWQRLGYGILGTGLYVDPLVEPLKYLKAVLCNGPLLFMGQFAFPGSDLGMVLGPTGGRALLAFAVIVVVLVGLVLTPLVRKDRLARFFAIGAALALLPACAAFPLDRLLFFVGFGAMGLIARFLAESPPTPRTNASEVFSQRLAKPAKYFLLFTHLGAAPLLFPIRAAFPFGPPSLVRQLEVNAPMDSSVEAQDVIIVNAPSAMHAVYLPLIRETMGLPVPRRTMILGPAIPSVRITRFDEHTLVIRPALGFLPWKFDRLFRPEDCPMKVGQRVELIGLTVEVLSVSSDGTPTEAAFRFTVPLEDGSMRWLCWREGEFVPFKLPVIGETIEMVGRFRPIL